MVSLAACQRAGEQAPPTPEVGVVKVTPRAVSVSDNFNGRVAAVDTVELRPRVSGYLQNVTYREGEAVQKGAVMFIIDQRPYRIALDQANAEWQRAKAISLLAQVQLERVRKLFSSRATSQEELDNSEGSAAQAVASMHAAAAALDDAKLNLSYTEVRAPIAGRAGRAELTTGNLARADQTLLTTVVSQDPVYIYFDCDEQSYLRYLAQRTDAKGRAIDSSNAVHFALANEAGFPHRGTVDFLNNQLDPATGTIRARVRVTNATHDLTPGLYARVQLVSGRDTSALLVDDKAVLTDQDRRYVYVVGKGDRAERRDLKLGREIDGQRIVESGLTRGDRVIVEGVQRIYYPGAPIKPKALADAPKLAQVQEASPR